MKALITASLFEPGRVSALDLAMLFRMGAEGQHVILPEPLQAPSFTSWRGRQDLAMQEEIDFAVEHSLELESHHPPAHQILINSVEAPSWGPPPVLPLATALDLLREPMVLLVENKRNDAAFLRCLADRFQRKELERSEERGWLRFDHGGGLPEMLQALEQKKNETLFRHRTWFLFDSDALAPALPSKVSQKLRNKCEQLGIACHQLSRRAAENYLPPAALEKAAGADQNGKRRARAFRRLTLDQRSHFNMKRGLRGDIDRVGQESKASEKERQAAAAQTKLFSQIDEADRTSLQSGFGSRISDLFASSEILSNFQWFRDDTSIDEMYPVIEKLLGDR